MNRLYELIAKSEDWLVNRILYYAKKLNYVKYTSTLEEAWRLSIAGLSDTLLKVLRTYDRIPDLGPDLDFSQDPVAAFGILQARKHCERGIELGMFLGLMKYYRQSYIDLILDADFEADFKEQCRIFVNRIFDRIEIGLCSEWSELSESELVMKLQANNRNITNEKNQFLTIFESLPNPVLVLDKENRIKNMNHAAAKMFRGSSKPGANYYGNETEEEILKWLADELISFAAGDDTEFLFEKEIKLENTSRHFEIKFVRMLDVSEKFIGTVLMLYDITDRKLAEKNLQHRVQLEEIVNIISTKFINLRPENIDKEIDEALRLIGEFAGVDRSYIFLFAGDGTRMDNTHEWCAAGIEPQTEKLQGIDTTALPWLMEQLNKLNNVYVPCVADFPPAAVAEKEYLLDQEIKSVVVVPMVYNESLIGFLGFDSVKTEKAWSDDCISLLRIVGEIIVGALMRNRAEEALREQKEFSERLILNSTVPTFVLDPQHRVIFWNKACENLTGVKASEVIGTDNHWKAFYDHKRPCMADMVINGKLEDLPEHYDLHIESDVVSGGLHGEGWYPNLGGAARYIIFDASPIRNNKGELIAVLETLQDLTERRLAVEALAEQKAFAEKLVQNSAVPSFVLDPDHKVIMWNKACEELTGVKASELIGTDNHWRAFYDHKRPCLADIVLDGEFKDLSVFYDVYSKSSLVSEGLQSEGWYPNLGGKDRYIFFDAAPIRNSKGEIIAVIETLQDITRLKQAEEKIINLNRLYSILSEINQLTVRMRDEQEFFENICCIIVEHGFFKMAWIGIIDAEIGLIIPVAHYGVEEGYLDNIMISVKDDPESTGPSGTAACEGVYSVCNDIENDPRMFPWRDEAIKRGFRSSAAFPLKVDNKVLGVLNIYASKANYFGVEEIQLLNKYAADISFALEYLKQEELRKEAEAALRESEEKARTITEAAMDAIITIDNQGLVAYWNSSAERIFGYASHEVMGKELYSLIAPAKYLADFKKGFSTFKTSGQGDAVGNTVELSALRKDGTEFPVELSLSSFKMNGQWHATGIVRDITERKQAEEALAKSRDFYLTLFEEFPALIRRSGVDGKCNYFNKSWLNFTGRTMEQELGDGWAEGVHPEDLDRCIKTYLDAFNARQPFEMEYRLRRFDGEYRWIVDFGRPYNDLDGSFAGYIGACYDITERKLAEEVLLEKDKRVQKELQLASIIQSSLFPMCLPEVPGISLSAITVPAYEVGGDYCDLFVGKNNKLGIAVGDVMGKGIPAAMFVALAYAFVRNHASETDSPAAILRAVNRVLFHQLEFSQQFITLFYATYDPVTRELIYANAGHNRPIVYREATGECEILKVKNFFLGGRYDVEFREGKCELYPGDIALFYTDGLKEGRNREKEQFGEERIVRLLKQNSMFDSASIVEIILDEFNRFIDNESLHDDISIIIMKIT